MTTHITNARIVLSIGVIVAITAAAMGATYAAWTASDDIANNTVSTANVSLTAAGDANSSSVPSPVNVSNVLPGYIASSTTGEFRTLVTNNGTVPLKVYMYLEPSSTTTCASTKIAYQSSVPNSTTIHYGYYPYTQLTSPEDALFHFVNDVTLASGKLPVVDSLAPGATVAVRTVPALATDAPNSLQNTTCTWNQVYYGETI